MCAETGPEQFLPIGHVAPEVTCTVLVDGVAAHELDLRLRSLARQQSLHGGCTELTPRSPALSPEGERELSTPPLFLGGSRFCAGLLPGVLCTPSDRPAL